MSPKPKPKKPLTPEQKAQYNLAMRLSSEGRAAVCNVRSHGDIHNPVTDKNLIFALERALKDKSYEPQVNVGKPNEDLKGVRYSVWDIGSTLVVNVDTRGIIRTLRTFRKLDNGTWIDIKSPNFKKR